MECSKSENPALALAELEESTQRKRRQPASEGWREVSVHLLEPAPEDEQSLQLADERLGQLAERALMAHLKNIGAYNEAK
jgi:hypothetical protein